MSAEEASYWENPALSAENGERDSEGWANYGGDKTWPSPQSGWERAAGRGWPPPQAFDGLPAEARIEGDSAVTLVSAVEPGYGIRARRRIELAADRPVLTVTTTYDKISGPPVEVAVWVITQVKDPALVCAPLSGATGNAQGFVPQSDELPAGLHVAGQLLSLTRDFRQNHKIGMQAATLVWVGATELLRIDSSLVAGAKYPDDGLQRGDLHERRSAALR